MDSATNNYKYLILSYYLLTCVKKLLHSLTNLYFSENLANLKVLPCVVTASRPRFDDALL